MYVRFAAGLPRLLNERTTLDEAIAVIRHRLEHRDDHFLRLIERGVFGYPASPYLPLMREAGCTFADVHRMVRTDGLEPTLLQLRREGVYVTFEEFKGRVPIARGKTLVSVQSGDFDNPFLTRHYHAETGGSTGAGSRVSVDAEHLAARAPDTMLAYHVHGVLGAPTAVWRGILPDASGLNNFLRGPRIGHTPVKWFSPVTRRDLRPSLKNRLATTGIRAIARTSGLRIPPAEPIPLDRAVVVADWAAAAVRRHGRALVRANVSLSLRAALAAADAGIGLDGVTFMGGGEPPTPGKVRGITAGGARWAPMYAMTETGRLGIGCANPVDGNDLHLLKHAVALVTHQQTVPGTAIEVPAFCLTSLLLSAPKILLNVETDDYGVVEQRRCGCPLESYGFVDHLRHVRSFRKLTGEGMTLVGSEMERILEDTLPGKFGGGPLDYQLTEEEDERGLTRLTILVSPHLPIADEHSIVETVLTELGRGTDGADVARAYWRQAETFRVRRAAPVWTGRGKLMPLHLGDRGAGARGARRSSDPR
jgi:hypothetical protein